MLGIDAPAKTFELATPWSTAFKFAYLAMSSVHAGFGELQQTLHL
jgi:hypothetical protein